MFKNRQEAGKLLAKKLIKYRKKNIAILALPRGGVVCGAEIARDLKAPLDLVLVSKIGHPFNPEYAIGAITEKGTLVENKEETSTINSVILKELKKEAWKKAENRRRIYLKNRKPIPLKGKNIIVVDDGLATGLSIQAALLEVQKEKPAKIIIALPVAPKDFVEKLPRNIEKVILLNEKNFRSAVGAYFDDFSEVSDDEVINLLKETKNF